MVSDANVDMRRPVAIKDEGYLPGRWLMLGVVWFVYLVACMDRVLWGAIAVEFGKSLGAQIATLGALVTAFYVGNVVATCVAGFVCDAIGARLLLIGALFPLGIFTFAFGSVHSIGVAIAVQALMGVFAAADTVAGLKLTSIMFGRRQRGRAMGIFLTGTSLAIIIVNAIVPSLIPSIGWQGVCRIFGVLTALSGILVVLVLREPPPSTQVTQRSQVGTLVRNRNLPIVAFAGFGALWAEWGFVYWANTLMVTGAKVSPIDAGVVVALFGFGALIGKPLCGLVSDLVGGRRKVPTIVLLTGFVIGLLGFGHVPSLLGFMLIAPVLGICGFAFIPLLLAAASDASPPEQTGTAMGLINTIWLLGSMVAQPTVGAVYQATGSFNGAFFTLAAGPIIAIVIVLFMREPRRI